VGELRSDPEAAYEQTFAFDLDAVAPTVAPPFSPDTGVPVGELGEVPIDVAWVGSCTGGKLEDVQAAADVVRGHRVAAGVRLIVAPATVGVMEEAGRRGFLRDILAAGGQIVQPGCGACIGMGPGTLAADEVGVFASNRNFKGRAGKGEVYLASPATVAASALAGRVADPRDYLSDE
jgi:homoaconitase/3-isopropylmalate dehydratase large subunit